MILRCRVYRGYDCRSHRFKYCKEEVQCERIKKKMCHPSICVGGDFVRLGRTRELLDPFPRSGS